jgi:hypothetical protein
MRAGNPHERFSPGTVLGESPICFEAINVRKKPRLNNFDMKEFFTWVHASLFPGTLMRKNVVLSRLSPHGVAV